MSDNPYTAVAEKMIPELLASTELTTFGEVNKAAGKTRFYQSDCGDITDAFDAVEDGASALIVNKQGNFAAKAPEGHEDWLRDHGFADDQIPGRAAPKQKRRKRQVSPDDVDVTRKAAIAAKSPADFAALYESAPAQKRPNLLALATAEQRDLVVSQISDDDILAGL